MPSIVDINMSYQLMQKKLLLKKKKVLCQFFIGMVSRVLDHAKAPCLPHVSGNTQHVISLYHIILFVSNRISNYNMFFNFDFDIFLDN